MRFGVEQVFAHTTPTLVHVKQSQKRGIYICLVNLRFVVFLDRKFVAACDDERYSGMCPIGPVAIVMVGSQNNQTVIPLPILVQRINQSPKVEVKIVGALEIEQLLLHEVLVLIVAKAFREMMRIRRVGRDGDGGDK